MEFTRNRGYSLRPAVRARPAPGFTFVECPTCRAQYHVYTTDVGTTVLPANTSRYLPASDAETIRFIQDRRCEALAHLCDRCPEHSVLCRRWDTEDTPL